MVYYTQLIHDWFLFLCYSPINRHIHVLWVVIWLRTNKYFKQMKQCLKYSLCTVWPLQVTIIGRGGSSWRDDSALGWQDIPLTNPICSHNVLIEALSLYSVGAYPGFVELEVYAGDSHMLITLVCKCAFLGCICLAKFSNHYCIIYRDDGLQMYQWTL